MSVTYNGLGSNGRCGNMLFQMAATIGVAIKNNDSFIFPHWQYENDFNIPKHHFVDSVTFSNTFTERGFEYQEIPYSQNLNVVGYFQSYKYFEHCKDKILDLFTMKLGHEIIRGSTAIHVRRSDYITAPNCYVDLSSTDYYERAIQTIGPSNYFIFSDDVEFCKRRFANIQNKIIVDNGGDVIKDFNTMTRCENQIIANSSLSWWAAYLNKNVNKKIIASKQWFGPKLSYNNTKDLIPPEWTLI